MLHVHHRSCGGSALTSFSFWDPDCPSSYYLKPCSCCTGKESGGSVYLFFRLQFGSNTSYCEHLVGQSKLNKQACFKMSTEELTLSQGGN